MPTWLVPLLLVVFAAHLLFFLRLAVMRRSRRLGLVALTFALLVLAFALRLWRPEWRLLGARAYWWPRLLAWVGGGASAVLFVRRRALPAPDQKSAGTSVESSRR